MAQSKTPVVTPSPAPSVKAADKSKLVSVIAKVPVDHDGERYEIGDPFEVGGKELEQLLAVDAVSRDAVEESADSKGGE